MRSILARREGLRPVSAWRPCWAGNQAEKIRRRLRSPRRATSTPASEIAHTHQDNRATRLFAETALVKRGPRESPSKPRSGSDAAEHDCFGEEQHRTSPRVAPNERRMPISCCRRTTDPETVL